MTIDDELAQLKPRIEAMVWSRAGADEDAVQEAMIAAWQERTADPEAPMSHAMQTAKLRVSKHLIGRPLTGEPRKPGRQDAHDFTRPLTVVVDGEEFPVVDPEDVAAATALSAAELRERILAAVNGLENDEDRQAVYLRFWHDLDWKAIGLHLGRPQGTLSRRWTERVRPYLQEVLADLDFAV